MLLKEFLPIAEVEEDFWHLYSTPHTTLISSSPSNTHNTTNTLSPTMPPSSTSNAKVTVALYDPIDERDPNHWAIYITSPSKGDAILQIEDDKGGKGYYVAEPKRDKQPQRSTRFQVGIDCGTTEEESYDTAVAVIQSTAVDNESKTWNCQAWVIEALDNAEDAGVFSWNGGAKEQLQEKRQNWQ